MARHQGAHRRMTSVRTILGKSTIQAVLALTMAGLLIYGFVSGKLSGEAILPIAGAAILYFFPGNKPTEK